MARNHSIASAEVVAPLRAASAQAGAQRGNLPFVQQKSTQDKFHEPLGYLGYLAAHTPAFRQSGTSNGRRDLKSAGSMTQSPKAGSMTQIVMFPTPTHVVRPATEASRSTSTPLLPQVPEHRAFRSSQPLSSSAPVLATITSEHLAMRNSRDEPLDKARSLDTGVNSMDGSQVASAPAQKSKLRRTATFSSLPMPTNDSASEKSGSEEYESGDEGKSKTLPRQVSQEFARASVTSQNDAAQQSASGRRGSVGDGFCRRRTFHHTYSKDADDPEDSWHVANEPRDSVATMGVAMAFPDDIDEVLSRSSSRVHSSRHKDPEVQACREAFRKELLGASGCGDELTFRHIDLNRNGQLSLQEFEDGLARLYIDWQKVTGRKTIKDVYKLFQGKDGIIRLHDLFPDTQRSKLDEPSRMSTPEFWNHWCRSSSKDFNTNRGPKWKAADQDEELQGLFASTSNRQDVSDRKRWMSQTIRRMKKQGKTDARCREMCALHLPRGSGPRDRDYVHTFSQTEVKSCRRNYADAVSIPLRNIQKQVFAMREQRMELQHSRMQLSRMNQRSVREKKKTSHLRRKETGCGLVSFADMDFEDDCEEEEEDSLEVGAGDAS